MNFTNRLQGMKSARAKMRAYGDGGPAMSAMDYDDADRASKPANPEWLRSQFSMNPQSNSAEDVASDVAVGFTPGLGTLQAARDFSIAAKEGDKTGMALNALGLIPEVGGVIKGVGKVAKKVTKGRNPLLEAAQEKLLNTPVDTPEFDELWKARDQYITPKAILKPEELRPLTDYGTLSDYENVAGKTPLDTSVPAGTIVEARPNLKAPGLITIHPKSNSAEPTESLMHDTHFLLNNFEPHYTPNSSAKTAIGAKKKPNFRLTGEYVPIDQEQATAMAKQMAADPVRYRQVTFDPLNHGYLYDIATGTPIAGGKKVLSYGQRLFVEKPIQTSIDALKLKVKEGEIPLIYKDGGKVEESKRALGNKLFGLG